MADEDFTTPDLTTVGPGETAKKQTGDPETLTLSTEGEVYEEDFLQTIVGIKFGSNIIAVQYEKKAK